MRSILLIIEREFMSRVRKKSFIITTLLTPLLIVGGMAIYMWVLTSKTDDVQVINVLDQTESLAVESVFKNSDELHFEVLPVQAVDQLRQKYLDTESKNILLVIDWSPDKQYKYALYGNKQIVVRIKERVEKQLIDYLESEKLKEFQVEGLKEAFQQIQSNTVVQTVKWNADGSNNSSNTFVVTGISYILTMIIYMFILIFGNMVMRGVIEEKSNRIIEVMISSVKPFELMMGKLLGIAGVALLQFLMWVLLTVGCVLVLGQYMQAPEVPSEMSSGMAQQMSTNMFHQIQSTLAGFNFGYVFSVFILYFIGGYLLYASLFAAVGSAVDSEADTQQLVIPITIPLIISMMIMMHVFQYPDSSLSFWASLFPLTSPMVMLARISFDVPFWQIALSLLILFASTILTCIIAGKIYRIGILMHGKKPTVKEMWKWLHYN